MKRSFREEIACAPAGDSGTGGTLAEAKETVTRAARETASKIKSTAADTAARARERVGDVAGEKKAAAAQRLEGYSSAIHESARALEEKDPNIAWFTHQAADRLESVADYVRTRDFGGLRADAEALARRHPAVFFGGLFAAGLILGNVLKAGRRSPAPEALPDFSPADDWEPQTAAERSPDQESL